MRSIYPIILFVFFISGCTAFRISPPEYQPTNMPAANARTDFMIETVDLIDRSNPIGNVGNRIWGGQYRVLLTDSLHDYFEAMVVRDLERKGYRCAEYPGESKANRLAESANGAPPLHLRLELQDLNLSRHPQSHLQADQVVGVCKIRGVLFDVEGDVLYQHQFVGKVDTYRPTDELVPPGVGLISRRGLSSLLSKLLESTVQDFREEGVPEIALIRADYQSSVTEVEHSAEEEFDARREETTPADLNTPPPTHETTSDEESDEEEEEPWEW